MSLIESSSFLCLTQTRYSGEIAEIPDSSAQTFLSIKTVFTIGKLWGKWNVSWLWVLDRPDIGAASLGFPPVSLAESENRLETQLKNKKDGLMGKVKIAFRGGRRVGKPGIRKAKKGNFR